MKWKKQLWLALFSFAMSFWLNLCLFLVAMVFAGKNPEPLVSRIADGFMTPPGMIVGWIFQPSHGGKIMVQAVGCSLVFYTVVVWCLATVCLLVRPRGRNPRTGD